MPFGVWSGLTWAGEEGAREGDVGRKTNRIKPPPFFLGWEQGTM